MLNLFKRNDSHEAHQKFQAGFSHDQKVAILGSLSIIAKSDGQTHPKESQRMEYARKMLGLDHDHPAVQHARQSELTHVIPHMSKLNNEQKKWFVKTVNGMIEADGKVEESEVDYAMDICEKLGISEDEYLGIIEKKKSFLKFW